MLDLKKIMFETLSTASILAGKINAKVGKKSIFFDENSNCMPSSPCEPNELKFGMWSSQARRQDSVTGGGEAEINFGGHEKLILCEFERGHGGTRNLSQSGSNKQGEEQKVNGIFLPKWEIQTVFPAKNR